MVGRDWHGRFIKGHEVPEKWKENYRINYKGKHSSPRTEFRKGSIPWNKGKENPFWKGDKNPMKNLEIRKKVAEKNRIANRLAYLKDPTLIRKVLIFRRPNNTEKRLTTLFQNHFPDEFRFVGDGSFVIEGLNPDWIDSKGKKLVIELFGEPWHEKEEEQKRIDTFGKHGFKTLILWWKDARNEKLVVEKVRNFLTNSGSAS